MTDVLFAAGGWEKYAALVLTGCAGVALMTFGVIAIKNRRAYVSRKGRRMLRLLFKTDEITGTWAIVVGGIQILTGLFVLAALSVFMFVDSAMNADKRLPNRHEEAQRFGTPENMFGTGESVDPENDEDSPEPDDAPDDSDFENGLAEHRAQAERFDRNFSRAADRISSRTEKNHRERMEQFDRDGARQQRMPLGQTPQVAIGPIDVGSMTIAWQEFGRASGNNFQTRTPDGSLFVGLGYALSDDRQLTRLVGIFQSGDQMFYGEGGSIEDADLTNELAPDGAIVASVELSTVRRSSIAALRLNYGKLTGGEVIPTGERSEWIGDPSGEPTTMLDGSGQPIVGIGGTYRRSFGHFKIGFATECDPPLESPRTAMPALSFEYSATNRLTADDMMSATLDLYDVSPQNGVLVGFRLAIDDRRGTVGVLQPVYQVGGRHSLGKPLGGDRLRETPRFTNVIAEDGYAVSGCEFQDFGGIRALTVYFAKMEGAKLSQADTYASDLIGGPSRSRREPAKLDSNGQLVVGVIASPHGMRGFGLVTIPESAVSVGIVDEPATIAPTEPSGTAEEAIVTPETPVDIPDSEPDFRTWTSTSGKTVTAKFIRRDDDRIVLETPKGKRAKTSLSKLSQADRDYVHGLGGE